MLIAGAGGHARETVGQLEQISSGWKIAFFDDVTPSQAPQMFGFPILRSVDEAAAWLHDDPDFCLGVGSPRARRLLANKLAQVGGKLTSVVSPAASVGRHEVEIGEGVMIMTGAVITERVRVGPGVLVHVHCSIHHDAVVGAYSELSPGSRILGNVSIGEDVSVGAGAIVLPGRRVGNGAVIGAGAVVTRDVAANATVKGVPAR